MTASAKEAFSQWYAKDLNYTGYCIALTVRVELINK